VSYGELEFVRPSEEDVIYGDRPCWRLRATPDVMMRLKRIFPRMETYRTEYVTLDHTTEVASTSSSQPTSRSRTGRCCSPMTSDWARA
jgi:hypothetical protein